MRILIRQLKDSKFGLLMLALLLPTFMISFLLNIQISNLNHEKLKIEKQERGLEVLKEYFSLLREAKNIMVNKEGSFYANTQSLSVNLTVPEKRWEALKNKVIEKNYIDPQNNISQLEEAQQIYKLTLRDFFDQRSKLGNIGETTVERVVLFFMDHSELRGETSLNGFYLNEGLIYRYSGLFTSFLFIGASTLDQVQKQKITEQIEIIGSALGKTKIHSNPFSLTKSEVDVILLQLELLKTYVNGAVSNKSTKDLFVFTQKIESAQNQLNTFFDVQKQNLIKQSQHLLIAIFMLYALFLMVIFGLLKLSNIQFQFNRVRFLNFNFNLNTKFNKNLNLRSLFKSSQNSTSESLKKDETFKKSA